MTGSASYNKILRVSTTPQGMSPSWANLPIESAELSEGATVIEDTHLVATSGYRTNILGLLNWSISAECVRTYSGVGDTALDRVRSAMVNRTDLYIQYLPRGTSNLDDGVHGQVVIESFNQSGGLDDKEMVSISFQPVGRLDTAS